MEDNLDRLISRRSLLRRGSCAALGLGGLLSQVYTLRMTQAALADTAFNDYRALVCVFMFGGNDSGNTLVPMAGAPNGQDYGFYAQSRGDLALPQNDLSATAISPGNTGGRTFALHPALGDLADLFTAGDLAVLANVGTLVRPVTRAQYQSGSVALPPQLFAHNTQQELWQISTADAASRVGWGGRVADVLQSCGANPDARVSMNLSIAGSNFFLAGNRVSPFTLKAGGVGGLTATGIGQNNNERDAVIQAYADLLAMQQSPAFSGRGEVRRAYADVAQRAVLSSDILETVFDGGTAVVPPSPATSLARQLQTVARLIERGPTTLNHQRQVFFVSTGGYDNHDGLVAGPGQLGPHGLRLRELNDALKYFYDTLGTLGVRDRVTTFTASDFGRTFKSNGNGSDHGWGGHQFVMGGSQVDGGKLYGSFNDLTIDGPEDTGNGRFIPTTSVDEYAVEMARWMGVPASELDTVFPNLRFFTGARPPLGMLR